ncbi:MAG: bifunctional adenosylcobinamide kinase/adenosylcobinamide-phosphate guanylyltransferase [Actinomycetota bacterium]|nr:bifunctional adenosylcobinamide kinase/adenosylcobinamide-phosphate guanylyltransferase [Actinomycetota bacterium]MDD5668256.1 bifunctional adenosylcobinamide kinase/adenosylcobinamide-phosphate guanylyltransferase [Actinomycetota bacterium]
MEKKMVLVIGGARSGKSTFAQRKAEESGRRVCYVATAEARDGEMDERISHHRRARPAGWLTLELEGGTVLNGLPASAGLALLDCFTVYLSNLMATKGLDWPVEEEDLMAEEEVLRLMEECEGEAMHMVERMHEEAETTIIVSNEVGMGVVPPYRLGRIFRDLAGRLNQRLAERADEVYLVVAGLHILVKGGRGGELGDT